MARESAYFYEAVTDDALASYLKKIIRIPLLSKEEELELGKAIQRGDEKALRKLVEANLRFVVKVAAQYQGCGLSLADLINEGNVGLLEAARRYSPEHNVKFITYAVWWIRQAILQALANAGGAVKLPLRKARLASRLREVQADLAQHLQREPSDEELKKELDLSPGELEELLQGGAVHSFLGDDVRGQERLSLELYRAQQLPSEEAELIKKSFREEVERMLKRLTAKERAVVEMRYGLGDEEPLTLEGVGKRLRLSRERVRQIEERAKQKLRAFAKARHLKDYLN